MNILKGALLCSALLIFGANDVSSSQIIAGYVPGMCGMTPVNRTNCMSYELYNNSLLSSSLDCARTCEEGKPKNCYYHFVVERYPVYGTACKYCSPDYSTSICPNCQCVVANGVQRSLLSVNRMLPGPSIQVCLGDFIVIDVENMISEEHITIHWHGLFQYGSQYYDGVPFVTQCPIASGDIFRYQFHANNSGTHFWHSHIGLQKMNGVSGSFIVREPAEQDPSIDLYDYDLASHVLFISDWMNENAVERYPGREWGVVGQRPDTLLINGRGQFLINGTDTINSNMEIIIVDANNRYRFRMINSFCGNCPGELTIEGHNMTVIATDGESVQPVVVTSIVSYAGERYDFVINTNQTPGAYWIQLRALEECNSGIQQLAILQYSNASTIPFTDEPTYFGGLPTGTVLNPTIGNCEQSVPNAICVSQLKSAEPADETALQAEPDQKFYLPISVIHQNQQQFFSPNTYKDFLVPIPNRVASQIIDSVNFKNAPSPPISQLEDLPADQFCNSQDLPRGCTANCTCTHMIEISLNAIAEIILIDEFHAIGIEHPFHLHGYAFSVVSMGQPLGPSGNSTGYITVDYVKQLDANNEIERNLIDPPKKDTIAVPNNGFAVIKFEANNPGYWFFHCHFIYHQLSGMAMIVRVGEQEDLPPIPKKFPKCGNYMPEISIN
nr:laccase-2-like [Megalopta genalis]